MAYNMDFESSDLNDKHIQINTDGRNVQIKNQENIKANKKSENNNNNYIEQKKQEVATSLFQSATEQVSKNWYEKFICGLEFLKTYFNVTTTEVRKRLLHSLVPFNPVFYDISEKSPDLYGPFWIYTTLIFIIAAAGSLAKYIKGASTQNFFEEFVPIAAGIIYGIGFGLPIALTILMKCFGSATGFVSVLCTYGYSFTIFLPIVVVCAIPIDLMQWILIAYAVFSSTSFILVNYWKELSKYMEKKRYIVLGFILACQVGLFLVLKLYFFQRFTEEMGIKLDDSGKSNEENSSNPNNATINTNSTLLFL